MKQWPFAHSIEMTYRLADGALEVRTTITNHSAEPMPVAIGYHPYLQLTDSPRDEWTITVPSRTRWLPDYHSLVPYSPNPNGTGRGSRSLAPAPTPGATPGPAAATPPANPRATPDFVCIEPMAGIPNGLNLAHRGVYRELQSIAPNGSWQESFWIEATGF